MSWRIATPGRPPRQPWYHDPAQAQNAAVYSAAANGWAKVVAADGTVVAIVNLPPEDPASWEAPVAVRRRRTGMLRRVLAG